MVTPGDGFNKPHCIQWNTHRAMQLHNSDNTKEYTSQPSQPPAAEHNFLLNCTLAVIHMLFYSEDMLFSACSQGFMSKSPCLAVAGDRCN